MRVILDVAKCMSNGLCESMAPEVFEVGDDDVVFVKAEPSTAADMAGCRQAARMCPTGAIALRESRDEQRDEQQGRSYG